MKSLMIALCVLGLALLANATLAAPAPAALSWEAPDTREDGTPLTVDEIKEYLIYYTIDGQTPGDGSPIVVNGTLGSEIVTLELLPRVAPYVVGFAISTVDMDGLKSERSEVVSKTFDVNSTAKPGAPTSLEFKMSCGDDCTITEKKTGG
jgi:hypothetical protein